MESILGPCRHVLRNRDFRELLGCMLLLGLGTSFVLPFLSIFGTIEVGMSPRLFSIFLIVTSLSAITASTILARWSDTGWTRRSILTVGCASGAAGYVGFAFVRDVPTLFILGVVFLGLSSAVFPQLFAYARDMIGRSDLPRAAAPLYLNVYRLTYALAWTIGPASASWLMLRHGFPGVFLATAAIFLLLLLLVLRVVPPSTASAVAQAAGQKPLRMVLARFDVLAHVAGFALLFAASTINMLNLPLLILETLGGSAGHVGIVYGIAPAFEIPLMFYFGLLASRGHQTQLVRAGAMIAVAYYAGLTVVQEPWQIYPLQVLAAALVAITSGIGISFFQDYLPDAPGTATNLFTTSSRIGAMIGYAGFGLLAEDLGHRGLLVLCTALCAVTGAIFLGRWKSPAIRGPHRERPLA